MPKTRGIEFSIQWQMEGKPRKTPTQNSNEKKICIRKKEPKTSERDVKAVPKVVMEKRSDAEDWTVTHLRWGWQGKKVIFRNFLLFSPHIGASFAIVITPSVILSPKLAKPLSLRQTRTLLIAYHPHPPVVDPSALFVYSETVSWIKRREKNDGWKKNLMRRLYSIHSVRYKLWAIVVLRIK